jgi:hypothetical protein
LRKEVIKTIEKSGKEIRLNEIVVGPVKETVDNIPIREAGKI